MDWQHVSIQTFSTIHMAAHMHEVISDANSTNLTNGSDFDDDADDRFESSAPVAADLISSADY